MKKTIALMILIMSITLVLFLPVQAADLDLVYDEVGLLTAEQSSVLNDLAQNITEQYQCEVSIVIAEDCGEDDIIDFAKIIYDEYDYGYGADKSGLMLFVSIEDRDYALKAVGSAGTAFTDHGKSVLAEDYLLPLLGEEKYYEAFSAYLNQTEEFLKMAESGTPFDKNTDEELVETDEKGSFGIKLAIVILVPLLIAGIVSFIFLGQMKTAVAQRKADHFMTDGGVNLTMKVDQFVSSSESRTKIEKSTGTSTAGDGSSNSKGKF